MNTQPKKTRREISAGIVIYRRTPEGIKFLILYHGGSYWNFPKGRIEKEEKSFAAAVREVYEEAGISSHDLKITPNFKAYEKFYFRRGGQSIFKIVIFYLAETRLVQVKISREHQGYGWFQFKDAQRILGRYKDSQRVLKQTHDFLTRRSREQK